MSKKSLDATTVLPNQGAGRDAGPTVFPPGVISSSPCERVLCDDVDLRIDRQGVWHYQGSPIRRKELVCLFASVLTRDADGEYWLATPTELAPIVVDDAPFLAVELFVGGSGCEQAISFRTNVDEIVTVDADHPLHVETNPATGEPSPYVVLREGIKARIARSVYYHLVAHGVEEESNGMHLFGVWSSGSFFVLGNPDADG